MLDDFLRLTVQLWDRDLVSANDCIGESYVSLAKWMRKIYKRRTLSTSARAKGAVYWDSKQHWDARGPPERPKTDHEEKKSFVPGLDSLKDVVASLVEGQKEPLLGNTLEDDPDLEAAKFWLPVFVRRTDYGKKATPRGKILLSIQLVPVDDVKKFAAGHGRKKPNTNPVLPRPTGRLQFSLNPLRMLYRLIGPKFMNRLARVLCSFLCCFILILLVYNMFPVVFGNLLTGNVG